MAVHGKNARILLDDIHLSAYLNQFEPRLGVDMADVSTFVDEGHRYVPGLDNDTLAAAGHFDADGNSSIQANLGTDTVEIFTAGPGGLAVGSETFSATAKKSRYAVSSPIGDRVQFTFDATADGSLERGVSLHDLTAEDITGNGDSVDQDASSSDGAVAFLHVTSLVDEVDVKVQHSADDETFVDLITFSTADAAGAQRVAVSGTVNRYVRVTWSPTGAATFAVAFARL